MNGRSSKVPVAIGLLRNGRRARGAPRPALRTAGASLLGAALALSGLTARAQTPEAVEEPRLVELKTDPLSVSPIVLLQVQAIPYVGEQAFFQAGDVAEQAGFRLRRARFGLSGELYDGLVPFAISADLVSNESASARVNDAWVGYRHADWLALYVGAHKVPFSRSALMSASTMALVEQPLAVRAMAPSQQVGAHVEGSFWRGALTYQVGVFNGFQRSDQFFGGYRQNTAAWGNQFDELAYSGRLSTEPFGEIGTQIADLDHSDKLRFGAGVSYFFSDGGTRNIHGGNADVLVHARGVHFLGEFLWNQSDPEENPTQSTTQIARVKSVAFLGEAGYTILKNRLVVSTRLEWINPNTDVASENDTLVSTTGVSYFVVEDLLKAQADYTHRAELGGTSVKNDAVAVQLQLSL